ncbi:MAG TPA: hypothetical protein VFO34_00815 [Candidatus Acidoferrales bacterium]|nr:hypothetical protein [Candidatus Acidoferrales bacterium]
MAKEKSGGAVSTAVKWAGYLTLIFSICGTVWGVGKYLRAQAETRKSVAALVATAAEEQKARDYSSAWGTLDRAVQLDADADTVQTAQLNLAMAWLEDVHLSENQKFSDVTGKVEPVLVRAAAGMRAGARRADVRAYIGWAYFLDTRDGRMDLDPARAYQDVTAEDPNNPYAGAMWGHWILWRRCEQLPEAKKHFDAALASGREASFVRRLEMSAVLNCHTDAANAEAVRTANEMRKAGEKVSEAMVSDLLAIYSYEFSPASSSTAEFVRAVPPAEHLATFDWLFGGLDPGTGNAWARAYYRGAIEEAAGQRDSALADYRLASDHLSQGSSELGQPARAAVKRLTQAH